MSSFARPRAIQPGDDYSSFDCGELTLDEWVRTRALKNEKTGASRTFVSIEAASGRVAGYYCLSASSLGHEEATSSLRRNMPSPIPVILIGRLAVDAEFRGLGLGVSLLQDAILKGIEASRIVGARALVVHAISASAEQFYLKFGFTLVPDSARVMFVTVADAEATIASLLA
ncbi:GNAT family N-acetyltransferase [Microterricola viridarii]|uniref:Predicted N-acetyltransferase YhbS n=1 Tax=Microterricola viridarii TaxID=412690 RepID=A0A1H1XD39_9MICO|nr:GNAT family N-acetyltransferase [Microterricola viridarii]SDT07224.1 Predicted N-acetyltransferase YhbS [Microterricola viridarii]